MKLSCECEAEYYKDMFDRHNYSVRQILRNLNTICSFKSSQGSKSVFKLLIKRKEVFDHKTICSEFNNYFSTVGELLIQNLQQTTLTGTVSNFQQYCQSVSSSMFCEPVNIPELVSIIKNMKKNKSPGPYNIGTSILKEIAPSILHLFFYTLLICHFPLVVYQTV